MGRGHRGPCQGDGGEGGRQSRLRDLVVRLPNAGAAPSGFSVRRNDAVGCAGMTKGGSRFSSLFRYYRAVTIWEAQRGSCGRAISIRLETRVVAGVARVMLDSRPDPVYMRGSYILG